MTPDAEHSWFIEHVEAYLAGGLARADRARFEQHAAGCVACAAALAQARSADEALRALFAGALPDGGFEDRIAHGPWRAETQAFTAMAAQNSIQSPTGDAMIAQSTGSPFMFASPRVLHPVIRKAAAGIAAAIVLGAVGFVGSRCMNNGSLSAPSDGLWHHRQVAMAGDEPAAAPADENAHHRELARGVDLDGGTLLLGGQTLDEKGKILSFSRATNGEGRGIDGTRGESESWRIEPSHGSSAGNETGLEIEHGLQKADLGRESTLGARVGDALKKRVEPNGVRDLSYRPSEIMAGKARAADDYGLKGDSGGWAYNPDTADKHSDIDSKKTASRASESKLDAVVVNSPAPSSSAVTLIAGDFPNSPAEPGSTLKPFVRTVTLEPLNVQLGDKSAYSDSVQTGPPQAGPPQAGKPQAGEGDVIHRGDSFVGGLSEAGKEIPTVQKPVINDAFPPVALADQPAATGNFTPPPPSNLQPATQDVMSRKIIRNGEMQFEVDSFDSAAAQVGKIVAEESGFIATTDSEKLPNGKVKGTIVLRVPPDHLDQLVLKLRGLGDLKNQRIAAQDVTREFTDYESELRAARAMEERLLELIKNGKGEVKDLVAAETELGVWREKIEKSEGELRYMQNQISLSTLAVTLLERGIKTPAAAFETETVSAGIETEDITKARDQVTAAITDLKGRVIESNLKEYDADRFDATIVAEAPPDATGPLIDRLKQIGRIARMDSNRRQTTEGDSSVPGLKVERKATVFSISLYNLANVSPRKTANVSVACKDVKAAYDAILAAVNADAEKRAADGNAGKPAVADAAKPAAAGDARKPVAAAVAVAEPLAGPMAPAAAAFLKTPDARIGRIISNSLNSQRPNQTSGVINLEVRSDQTAALDAVIHAGGEVMKMATTENPDIEHTTTSKQGFIIQLLSLSQVPARDATVLQVAARDVPGLYNRILSAVQSPQIAASGASRILTSMLNEQDGQNVTGTLEFEILRSDAPAILSLMGRPGESDVISRNIGRLSDADNTADSKIRVTISLINIDRLPPQETTTLTIDVDKVEGAIEDLSAAAGVQKGRIIERRLSREQNGRIDGRLVIDVPLAAAPAILDHIKGEGPVRAVESSRNPQIPQGSLSTARFEVTFDNTGQFVGPDKGLIASFRQGLRTSIAGLLLSIQWLLVGLCLIVPWAVILWAVWKLFRRAKPKAGGASPATA